MECKPFIVNLHAVSSSDSQNEILMQEKMTANFLLFDPSFSGSLT